MGTLNAAVIGAGRQGRIHAAKLARIDGVRLAAVVDRDLDLARRVAGLHRAEYCDSIERLPREIHLAVVAIPPYLHCPVAKALMSSGVAVFVEKPIATTLDDALALVAMAEALGILLQVGHVERFNPAFLKAIDHCDQPRLIDARRMSSFTRQPAYVDVVLDLMIHDVDLVLHCLAVPLVAIEATGGGRRPGNLDYAEAWLEFADGRRAHLAASRVAAQRVREMRIRQSGLNMTVDFLSHSVIMERPSGAADRQVFPGADPLYAQLRDFVEAVRSSRPPQVAGQDGLRALKVALAITGGIREGRDQFAFA